MLILFGTKVRMKVLEALVFACPQCRTDRQGALVAMRRWFTLFFIPVLPLNEIGRAVRCDTCRKSFEPSVLERPTSAALSEVHHGAVRVLSALLVGAGDPTSPVLRAKAVETIASIVPGYDDTTLTTDLQVLDPSQAPQYVAPLGESLALGARERFLADLARVATADGEPSPQQRQLLDEVGRSLGLTPAHVAGIVSTAGTSAGTAGFAGLPGGQPTGATWPPRPNGGPAATWPPRPEAAAPEAAPAPAGWGPPSGGPSTVTHDALPPGTLGAPLGDDELGRG